MKRPRDPALELARRLAAGETLDPAEVEAQAPQLARGIKRLSAIANSLRPDAPSGATWGHLQRLEHAGSGSFGDVYRAYDPTLDRTVALKLRRKDAPGAIFSGRDFVAEAQRLARVRHPHVLAVHGASYHDDRAGIWTDWIEGRTLYAQLGGDARLPREPLLRLAHDLAAALEAVHEAGLVHGDVKASNVMLDARGHALLMDFGAGFKSSDDATVLAAGTPRYLAPEVLRGEAASTAVDVYALGVLLHRAASGAYPKEAGAAILRPRALRRLVARMLSAEPQARPSAHEVLHALESIRAAPLRRARRIALGALITGLGAVAVVSWWSYRQAQTLQRETETALARSEAANRFLTELLGRASPDALGPTATLRDMLDTAPALIDQRFTGAGDRVALFELLARIEGGLHNDPVAARHAQAAADAAALIDPDSDDVLRLRAEALRRRAMAGEAQAVLPEAEALYARAVNERRPVQLRGTLGVALADVEMHHLMLHSDPAMRARMKDRLEALLLEPRALDARALGDANRRLARVRFETGDIKGGVAAARGALEASEAGFGPTHPATALNRNVLAWYLMDTGEQVEAERLLRLNLSLYTDKVGERSRTWFDNAMALSYALSNQKRHAEALPYAERAAALAPEIYAGNPLYEFDANLTLASALQGAGRVAEAEQVLRRTRDRIVTTWGDDNRHFLLATRSLAHLLRERGGVEEAQQLYRRCAADAGRLMGADTPIAVECGKHVQGEAN